MDLSKLARPAILCQCSRCSSSLAALENEWAKLSNSYAVAAGWLSVELHRISISTEKKQVPQNSEMSLLRGRILQEIACKLCQQKLGVLCALDDGPNIFWKLSKVSFREIVTMRTVEPLFNGSLERLIRPTPKESTTSRALISTGPHEVDRDPMSMEQQIQHQGVIIDHISNSVNNLHDTMSELKHSFTALRIELNGPGRLSSDISGPHGSDFDMIRTVLKELKSKAEEIETLKLEIQALKLKNRYMEEQTTRHPTATLGVESTAMPEVRSPGLLQASRKRPWPDSFPSGRTEPIADSFEEEEDDTFGDFSLADMHVQSVKIPLKEPEPVRAITDSSRHQIPPESPRLRIEVTRSRQHTPHYDNMIEDAQATTVDTQQPAVVKRPRISNPTDRPSSSGNTERRKPGRPRKSFSQSAQPEFSQTPKQTPLSEQSVNVGTGSQTEQVPLNTSPSEAPEARQRGSTRSRTLRSRSRPPSARQSGNGISQPMNGDQNTSEGSLSLATEEVSQHSNKEGGSQPQSHETDSTKENLPASTNVKAPSINNDDERRKAQVAARDLMARLAMQREEAMETEEGR
ncbi:uncharacterized protein CDV56_105177 [Aspergillus thermomutatus]|uniref:Yippee/Mis18/Cereblon domain-containing protein n=1 Tax=Aspergillus thermomutatus TaxID=41047 RepID=A0A397HBH3_ASPTH|nr:uncharacterized protein CDV56_105177 [Aspergillus thermomutatus]RHZ60445.1 hypothetical protein CDV56_105177 [Aspergillus thermomutatus]